MSENLNDKLTRLQEAKKKAEEITQRRQRLAGERDSHQKRLEELEKKCTEEYGCNVTELPGLIKQLETEAEGAIIEAERILATPGVTQNSPDITPVAKIIPSLATAKPNSGRLQELRPNVNTRKKPSNQDDDLLS